MNDMFLVIGWLTAICAGWLLLLLSILALVRMSNWTSHQVLEAYGGWKTFNKFCKWYWEQPENRIKGDA